MYHERARLDRGAGRPLARGARSRRAGGGDAACYVPGVVLQRTCFSFARILLAAAVPVASFVACSADGLGGTAPDAGVVQGKADAAAPEDSGSVTPSDAGASDVPDAGDAGDAGPKPPFACQTDAVFPTVLSVPEASAAAEVELKPGVRELLVVSDSGRGGVALLLALPHGGSTRSITLPLDTPAVDDTEGIAWRSGALYTLTSSGGVRRFKSDGNGGLVRDQDLYRLGDEPVACADLAAVNCGRNYEGLCLRPAGISHPCAGYAASKAESKLYCLGIDGAGKLFAKTDVPPIALNFPADQLSDCAFGAEGGVAAGVLVVTTNVFGLSRSYRVDETSGVTTRLPTKAVPNLEAIALDKDGALFVMDDNSTTTSTASKATCVGW